MQLTKTEVTIKLDNALVIEALSSWAGTLCQAGQISTKETNDLRISLNEMQCFHDQDLSTVIQVLNQNQSDFLFTLLNRYSPISLFRNLTRLTLHRHFFESLQEIHRLGCFIVPKVHLLFNRPIHEFIGGNCSKLSLFSSALLDYIEAIEDTAARINISLDTFSRLLPSEDPNHLTCDEDVAKNCGFDGGLETNTTYLSSDNISIANFSLGLRQFLNVTAEFLAMIQSNGLTGKTSSQIYLLTEDLDLHLDTLSRMTLPSTEDLDVWENKRLSTVMKVSNITETLKVLCGKLEGIFDRLGGSKPDKVVGIPKSIERRLVADLMEAGISAHEATATASKLVTYCANKGIRPADLIFGELTKIHPSFSQRTFQYLQSFDEDFALQNRSSHEKHMNMERLSRLSKVFRV